MFDRSKFASIGALDFGNNDIWEVFAPVQLPDENLDGFVRNNFPVWLASHDEIEVWETPAVFLGRYSETHHINEILIQLGTLLGEFVESQKPGGLVDPVDWAGSIISDAERHSEDPASVRSSIKEAIAQLTVESEPRAWRAKVASELNAYLASKK